MVAFSETADIEAEPLERKFAKLFYEVRAYLDHMAEDIRAAFITVLGDHRYWVDVPPSSSEEALEAWMQTNFNLREILTLAEYDEVVRLQYQKEHVTSRRHRSAL